MRDLLAVPPPPTEDKRWRIVEAAMRRGAYSPNCLIETLHAVQETFGCLDEASLRFCAGRLRVPLSKVYGVATFYHHFQLKPQGRHTCVVCLGTACYIRNSPRLLKAVTQEFGIEEGQTTEDKNLSLLTARCVGACSLAPVALLDGQTLPGQTPESLIERLKALPAEETKREAEK